MRHNDHHAVGLSVVYRAGVLEIVDFLFPVSTSSHTKEAHGAAILEIVLDIVGFSMDFHYELVE